MREANGNLWALEGDALCVTTNGSIRKDGQAVMGRGCALEASQRYRRLPRELGESLSSFGNHVYVFEFGPIKIVTFPVKHRWHEDADVFLIERSARELMTLVEHNGWQNVLLPRPGCGNGQLSWIDVKPRIEKILDDRVIVVDF